MITQDELENSKASDGFTPVAGFRGMMARHKAPFPDGTVEATRQPASEDHVANERVRGDQAPRGVAHREREGRKLQNQERSGEDMIRAKTERVAKSKALILGFLVAVPMVAWVLLAAGPVHAATFAVDRNDDPNPTTATTANACTAAANDCSLRGAIVAANAAAGADAITVPAGTYTLTRAGADEDAASTGDLDVTDELTITGAGARATSVAGGPAPFDDRIFDILDIQPDATATITGLTITGGKAGGIRSLRSDMTLDGVAVKGNTEGFGIFGTGGKLNLTDSTVSGNSSDTLGGIGYQTAGTVNITNSTISGNKATDQAGFSSGVVAADATLVNIRNSTIASNESGRLGGGILTIGAGTLVIVKNTIVAGNTLDNCDTAQAGGIIRSQGNNVSSDGSCSFTEPTDKRNTNPKLGPLRNNGGPTDTRALLAGSPAIDAGTNTGCPATDQRGVDRPQGPRCDIGAFERPNSPPVAKNDSYGGVEDKTLSVSAQRGVLRNDADADGDADGDALSASVVSRPKKGTLNLKPSGAFTYKPKKNVNGADSFVYRASDGRGGSDTARVTIRIKARPG